VPASPAPAPARAWAHRNRVDGGQAAPRCCPTHHSSPERSAARTADALHRSERRLSFRFEVGDGRPAHLGRRQQHPGAGRRARHRQLLAGADDGRAARGRAASVWYCKKNAATNVGRSAPRLLSDVIGRRTGHGVTVPRAQERRHCHTGE
jgi:hypothetical protein